jgi:hypothetical protein
MKKYLVFLTCMMLFSVSMAQYKNNKWLIGEIGDMWQPPWGGSKLEFQGTSRTISVEPRKFWLYSGYSGISDKDENWFVYSNGKVVCNKNHDTLVNGGVINGEGLSPGGDPFYASNIGHLLLFPRDTVSQRLYLFHTNLISSAPGFPLGNRPRVLNLFYSIIDPLAANGRGEVISKNNVVISDTLEAGSITAVRHANGSDWWVIMKRFYSDLFYSVLVTPDSVYAPISYSTQSSIFFLGGQTAISPDGKYWVTFANSLSQLRIFDVDRCSGLLSNQRYKFITSTFSGSVSFSPNSRFLYIGSADTLWQFDLQAQDILASQTFIAGYDGFVSNGQNTYFGYQWLAPDGKIYMDARQLTLKLHVINNPDLPGQACDFQQHGVDIPSYHIRTTPTPINLALYHLPGSPCDTLGVGSEKLKVESEKLKIFPNPSDGRFSVEYTPQRLSGMMYVYDVNGREVFREYVSPFTSVKNVDLSGKVHSGVYAVRLVWGNGSGVVGRVVVE